MNRRGFLGLLGGAAAAVIVGEIPSSKTFFLPPAGGWRMATDADYANLASAMARSLLHTKESVMARVLQDAQINGFGLAQIKQEGGSIAYDHVPYDRDGISLTSAAHPGSDGYDPDWTEDLWKCVNGHPFCNRCASGVDLNEASLEKLCIDIRTSFDGPIAIKPTHILPSPPPRRGLWRA